MIHDQSDADPGVWPAYVDALTNVILNLLFVVALLASAIIAMQLTHPRKNGDRVKHPPLPSQPTGIPALSGKGPALPASSPAGLPARPVEAPPAPVAAPVGKQDIVVLFNGADASIDQDPRARLLDHARQLVAAGMTHWQIHLATDLSDPDAKRIGYMRIVALRDLLLQAGVASGRIGVDFVDGQDLAPGTLNQKIELSASAAVPGQGNGPVRGAAQ